MFSTDELPLSPAPDAASAHPCSEGSPLSERPGVDMVLQGMAAGSGLASGRKPAYDGPRACRAPRRNLTDDVRPPAAWAESGLSAELLGRPAGRRSCAMSPRAEDPTSVRQSVIKQQ